jgi:hypothetical protein
MWADRLRDEPRFRTSINGLWGQALGVLDAALAAVLAERVPEQLGWTPAAATPAARNGHSDGFRELWDEMTMVRRSIPGASW